jgi:hypothetical protein
MADTPCGNWISAFSQKDLNPEISSRLSFINACILQDRPTVNAIELNDVTIAGRWAAVKGKAQWKG